MFSLIRESDDELRNVFAEMLVRFPVPGYDKAIKALNEISDPSIAIRAASVTLLLSK